LPPSIVLEIMKVLEKEIQLRDETRTAEQAKKANARVLGADEAAQKHHQRSLALADSQEDLNDRIDVVVEKILSLPNSGSFGKELALLSRVSEVMAESTSILSRPDTGPESIACETEIIELLLQTRRIQPKGGGGGGGSTPGGGGGGTTEASALALVGTGADENAHIVDRQVGQATGEAGRELPAEFRKGLDAYFNALEEGR
jgi:hypothetical protein